MYHRLWLVKVLSLNYKVISLLQPKRLAREWFMSGKCIFLYHELLHICCDKTTDIYIQHLCYFIQLLYRWLNLVGTPSWYGVFWFSKLFWKPAVCPTLLCQGCLQPVEHHILLIIRHVFAIILLQIYKNKTRNSRNLQKKSKKDDLSINMGTLSCVLSEMRLIK